MRLRSNAPMPVSRTVRTRVLLGATLGVAGLAAVPVAAEVVSDEPELDMTAISAPVDDPVAANPGLDRWYSTDETSDLAPDLETVVVTPADEEEATADVEPASTEPADEEPATDEAPAERSKWDRLAECESGEWVNGGESFIEGSARWDYGINFTHEGYEQFQGGLNFHPGTWDAYRDPGMPDHAGNATREQEIVVGERVLADQGWQAWPRCSRMVGLR
jgi:resuscitation-promoting factor RpfB